ncbi:G patch domain-containing protein 1-like [Oncorhynchus masou masou]|uniref:G patch domain-containing protein 1-like n=1 Tax=Oncorhynchus masou masou TaxID=90313 RepID=UPI003183DE50
MASDSDSDGDFVTFGTPLEPLEEDEPLRKPVPLHEQTVKDEKGRYQRFHGAFTGGFSAGYFNTVGTKEGWTPATFVSSRQQKAGRQNARPEDFMDEEDLGDHGIAPRQITTTADFASGRKDEIRDKARAITSLSAPIPGDTVLEDLVAPARSSMGAELLRRMGWKDGQGVGPRVKRRLCQQRADSATRAFGSASPPNGSSGSQDEEDGEFVPENVTFAPKDVTPIDFTPKVDLHGLGYRGLNPLAALRGGPGAGHINLFTMDSDRTNSLFGEDRKGHRRRGGVAGQWCGCDMTDIYHRDIMSNYDTVLGGEEPGDGLYGWTAPQQYNRKKKDHSKDASCYLGKILEGFTLASEKLETKTIFPPPNLPRDFRPVHYFRPVVDLSSVSPMVAQALRTSRGHMAQEEPSKGGRHQLDSAQRRELLGEATLQGPSSVFDLLKVEDRERLSGLRRPSSDTSSGPRQPTPGEARAAVVAAGVAAAAARASAQKALSSRFAPHAEQQQQEALSVWSGPTAQAQTGQTFRPFERTPHKQARYDLYIDQLKQGDRDALELSLDPTMTEWERGRERDEFVRAALLYKPSSSSLSCRFTRGKQDDGVEADTVEVTRDQENDVDDKQAAVKMKMFGKLTRDTFEWHPDNLLCKRFNIPDPYPGSGFVGMPKVKRDKFSVFNFLTVSESPTASASPAPQGVKPSEPGKRSRWDVSGQAGDKEKDPLSEFLSVARIEASGSGPEASTTDGPTTDPTGEPDTEQKEEEEEESRPSMDLFKAIFASSSDEKSSSSSEGESEEEEEKAEGVRSKAGTGPQIPNQLNVNTTQPAPPVSATPSQHPDVVFKTPSGPVAAPPPRDQEMEEEEFGPRLPPPSSTLTERRPSLTPSAKDDKHKKKCKEKHKAKKHGKHKKDRKQKKKHKRHKHKGKQKKSSRKEESSDSSSEGSDGNSQEDGEEGGGVSTEELLRRLKGIRGKNLQ